VYRAPGSTRGLTNLEAVKQVCAEFGFEAVDFAAQSVREQIAMMRGAEYIVAEHGAGLVNLVYCAGRSPKLLELYPPFYTVPQIYFIARTLHIQHCAWSCDAVSGLNPYERYAIVSLSAFRNCLQNWCD
jgi:capsular polysaccharide biosynthesis protein